ncbi:type I restriction enzyme specificity HsdS domain protein [Mycoplasma haemocanis str. Illinois]|uniref:Type I restriction enzyme specificity HsdS domain protein n=1 Tax=Mycoplasma haemocanis (strain Illinois) TaxID=1111676 RepID=H6N6Z0_MYCHN|nr:restriction endonuclease subunit S [Mycoplasma haemocanis]AEW45412.1 type I restriction enzyme specificity HsdS domain protein [Mycoplasma haemocanis str. Illinois]
MKQYLLGDICKVHIGANFKDSDYKKSGIPVLKSSGVNGGLISKDVVFYCDPEKALNESLVSFGDIVITGGASSGKVGINLTNIDYLPTSKIFKLEPDPSIVSKKYLYYFLLNSSREINSHITFGNTTNLYKSSLLKIRVFIPDLKTQDRVVRYLDKFRELREELRLRRRQGVYYRNKIMSDLQECALTKE